MADQSAATTPKPTPTEPVPQFTPEDINKLAQFFGLLIDIDQQNRKNNKPIRRL